MRHHTAAWYKLAKNW